MISLIIPGDPPRFVPEFVFYRWRTAIRDVWWGVDRHRVHLLGFLSWGSVDAKWDRFVVSMDFANSKGLIRELSRAYVESKGASW